VVEGWSMPMARQDRISRKPHGDDARSPFQIDRDRILYSMPFRRLAGVTQVVSPGEGEIFHNRLTHSLKVAQIARRIAERLTKTQPDEVQAWGGADADVVEAAALAHDLGHPPFGHAGERALDDLIAADLSPSTPKLATFERGDGYDGNAQTFRIVTRLAIRPAKGDYGLDLTRATLNAVLKYPWMRGGNPRELGKYGAYECDKTAFEFARTSFNAKGPNSVLERSLEAQIMDWSDDITYSVHDTEDFYRAGLIPLEQLARPSPERDRFFRHLMQRAELNQIEIDGRFLDTFTNLFDSIGVDTPYQGTRNQQSSLARFVSTNINEFVVNTNIVPPPGKDGEAIDPPEDICLQVFMLKELLWAYVIANPSLAANRLGQTRAIGKLFAEYNHAVKEKEWPLFPPFFREQAIDLYTSNRTAGDMPSGDRVRLVADTISSMTDRQALLAYRRFTGVSASSMLDPVVG
jgi:dGTPase